MSSDSHAQVCSGCGARIAAGTDRCELCGSEVSAEVEGATDPSPSVPPQMDSPDPRICPACSRKNRRDAGFCDQCGTPLRRSAALSKPPRPKAEGPSSKGSKKNKTTKKRKKGSAPTVAVGAGMHGEGTEPKQRVGLLLVGGVVVVAVLYGITVMSKSSPPAASPQPAAAQQVDADIGVYLPEDEGLARQTQPLLTAAHDATDTAQMISLRRQLLEIYAANGRLDLAGREQSTIALKQATATSWALAGNLHFDWMEQQSGPERVKAAKRSSEAYANSLSFDPDNLDVRTDLGVAYLNDPASPMEALRETNLVLETDSNHVQANFNKGVMLVQIGRPEDAMRHFEKVQEISEPGTPPYDRATALLDQIKTMP